MFGNRGFVRVSFFSYSLGIIWKFSDLYTVTDIKIHVYSETDHIIHAHNINSAIYFTIQYKLLLINGYSTIHLHSTTDLKVYSSTDL